MGETGRQPDAPDYAKTPLELLTARKGEGFSLFDKYGITTISTLSGVVGVYSFNRTQMRPFWAGFYNYFVFGLLGYWAGTQITKMVLEAAAENEAALKQYISLHPEDFPPYERRKLKDMFLPWVPIR